MMEPDFPRTLSHCDELLNCAVGFGDRGAVFHNSGQIGIRKGDAPEGMTAHEFRGRLLPVLPEEEAGLGR